MAFEIKYLYDKFIFVITLRPIRKVFFYAPTRGLTIKESLIFSILVLWWSLPEIDFLNKVTQYLINRMTES